MTDFCIAICTFRRADILPRTLESLAAMDRPDGAWSVLVVDNACDPAVERIVSDARGRLPIRYVGESAVGIARARNRAIESAEAPIVLFADDDVLFDSQWLVSMVRSVREHGDCQFWGGRIRPTWSVPVPKWFDMQRCPMLGDAIVRYDVGESPRMWNPASDPPFYTCNLGIRVQAVRDAGMFDVSLGHMGKKRGSGEDSWMIKSISRAGGKGWYAADAVLDHPVPPERVTRGYARRFAWRQGRVGVEMLRRESERTPRWLYRAAMEGAVKGMGRWAGGALRGDSARAFEGQFAALFNGSKLWHALCGRSE